MDEKHDTALTTKGTRRRWYQFSLRTLLLVVTGLGAVGAWCGSQVLIVRERRQVLALLGNTGDGMGCSSISYDDPNVPPPTINWFRRILGDYPANMLYIPKWAFDDAALMRRIRTAFPDARLDADPFDFGNTGVGPGSLQAEPQRSTPP